MHAHTHHVYLLVGGGGECAVLFYGSFVSETAFQLSISEVEVVGVLYQIMIRPLKLA